jgi:hypothetical protein
MTERLHVVGALLLMTVETHFRLLARRSHGIVEGVNLMAVRTRHVVTIVCGITPGVLQLVGMAAEANLILPRHGSNGVGAKIRDRRAWLAAADARSMRPAGAVARLALQLASGKGRIRVGSRTVSCLEQ